MPSRTPSSTSPIPDDGEAVCVRRHVERFTLGATDLDEDWIASEIPVALHYNDRAHVVMMATPMDLEDFALGFSLSEAIIDSPAQLHSVCVQQRLEGFEIGMRIPQDCAEAIAQHQRNLSGRSSCGLCGTRELEDVVRHPSPVGDGPLVPGAVLHRALAALDSAQPLNSRTGATHAAAWADAGGKLLLVREDVGRHNALDKLIGAMTARALPVQDGFLVLTSRASYEMVQKAATIGICLVVAISAPTALAIHLADSTGLTLVGFARATSHVVYTHPHRIRQVGS